MPANANSWPTRPGDPSTSRRARPASNQRVNQPTSEPINRSAGQLGFADESFLARLERLHLIAKRLTQRSGGARGTSRALGDGLEFADHRSYVPGDEPRFIDWPYYARMEKLLLRLFHQHSESDVGILLDCSASMATPVGKFDYARRVAAALSYVAMGSLQRVRLIPFAEGADTGLHTGRNRAQVLEVLGFLDALEPAGRTDLAAALRGLRDLEQLATVVIVSDLLDVGDALSDALARLRIPRIGVVAVHVISPDEAEGRLEGAVTLEHAETGRSLKLTADDALRAEYRKRWNRFRDACEKTCIARGGTYAAARTDQPFEQLILHTLRRAGVLQ